jgi:hypothetical protein
LGEEVVAVVCVLRVGKDFGPQHAQWLARQVPGIVCLSDQEVPGVETIPLRTKWPGWWAKMEALDARLIGGDVLLIDLDTVVFELPDMPRETTVLDDFYRPTLMGSGFMYLTEADRKRCFNLFCQRPELHMLRCGTRTRWGDQGFLNPLIGKSKRWGSEVRSYKLHCKDGVPHGTKVVCFHGKPRPWDVDADWIPPMKEAVC